jgi:DNA-binding MarR family transcriptional regulator
MNPEHFIQMLNHIDRAELTCRDVILLAIIIKRPGLNGRHLSQVANLNARSLVTSNIQRLERLGYIEDRKQMARKRVSANILHATEKGRNLWRLYETWGETDGAKHYDL